MSSVGRPHRRIALALVTSCLCGYAALIAFPGFLFAYSFTLDHVEVRSDHQIPTAGATEFVNEVRARLDRSSLVPGDTELRIYIANDQWRRRLLWLPAARTAYGYAAYPFTRNGAFISGADFAAGRLVAPDGTTIEEPRSLAYFGAHELTHVLMGVRFGWVRLLRSPSWIKEGVADYIAMEPQPGFQELYCAVAMKPNGPDLWRVQGYYAKQRLLIVYFMEIEGWSLDNLIASKLSETSALERMGAFVASRPSNGSTQQVAESCAFFAHPESSAQP